MHFYVFVVVSSQKRVAQVELKLEKVLLLCSGNAQITRYL